MKKFFLLAAMAGVALTGCVKTESEVAVKSDSNRIVFDNPVVSSVTRALIDGTEYPTDVPFSVYAQYKNANTGENLLYMENVTTKYVTSTPGTNQESWVPAGNYYWPKEGTLSFAAYSPTAASTVFNTVSWADDSGFTFDNFNAATNQANSYDLMYSDYVANQKQGDEDDYTKYYGIQLTFRHALSALVFRAKAADEYDGAEIKVKTIEVLEAYNQGDLATNNADNTAGWSDFQNPATMAVANIAGATLDHTDFAQQGDVLLMVPQAFDHNGGVQVKITYTIDTESNATMTQTHTVALSTLNEAGAGINTHADWKMGKRYIYDITIGLDRIYFAPTVTDWEDVTVTGEIE